jgi:glucose/arabinose dehydrogenase
MMRRPSIAAACSLTLALAGSALGQDGSAAGGGIEAITSTRVASGLIRPVYATHAPGDYKRLFIIEKRGVIRILNIRGGGGLNATNFLNIDALVGGGTTDDSEQGLLGMAFHPDYQQNGFFYVNYTNNAGSTVIARYTVSADPNVADAATADIIWTWAQPFPNHNAGWLDFGPDGYLYIPTGDGGNACDPGQRAQDITAQVLGKILRVDVNGDDFPADASRDYAIPPTNPFVDVTGDDEIWAYGLRNPWRCAFDRDTGDLYVADVGQMVWEEINVQPASSAGGENYGWDCMEGNACSSVSGCGAGACVCNAATLTDPVHVYSQSGTPCAVTGGYVYRGCAIPTLQGQYFFADYCSANISTFHWNGVGIENLVNRTTELDPPGALAINAVSSFGEDARGEIYVCDQFGEVFQIIPVVATISPYDLDCSGAVDVNDLVTTVLQWGPCNGCLADVNGDDEVNTVDLVDLVLDWD